ncbi:MAG: DUF5715 family protein, partial [Terracidiphilus sp.]
FMCRAEILVIALVVLIAGGAHAAQGFAPAKVHRKTTVAAGAPATRHAVIAHSKHRIAPAHTRAQKRTSTARRPTPNETGRTTGLAIRRKLARRQAAWRNVGLHEEHSRTASHRVSERVLHITHSSPAMEVASTSSAFLLPPAEAKEPARAEESATEEEMERPGASTRNQSRAATPMPAQTRSDDGITNEEMDYAEREVQRKTPLTADEDSQSENEDAGAGTNRIAPVTLDEGVEEASLRVPQGAMPAPLRGSLASLERQNTRLDAEGLERIENEADLEDRIAHKLLVPIPVSGALAVNAELPPTHRYCRPWTARFLADLAREHDAAFHRPLEVSSAVRTMEYQKRLMEINGNAAPAEGDIVSPHLTGATIDIAKDGLSRNEIAWMRRRLLALQTAGKIDVEEEFRQACFHITVYKSYAPPRTPRPAAEAGSGNTGTKRHKTPDPSTATASQGL